MDNDKIILRLKRVEGQIKGIRNMIMENRSCESILQQFSAARSALNKAAMAYIWKNMESSLYDDAKCSGETRERIKSLIDNLSRFV